MDRVVHHQEYVRAQVGGVRERVRRPPTLSPSGERAWSNMNPSTRGMSGMSSGATQRVSASVARRSVADTSRTRSYGARGTSDAMTSCPAGGGGADGQRGRSPADAREAPPASSAARGAGVGGGPSAPSGAGPPRVWRSPPSCRGAGDGCVPRMCASICRWKPAIDASTSAASTTRCAGQAALRAHPFARSRAGAPGDLRSGRRGGARACRGAAPRIAWPPRGAIERASSR